MFKYLFHFFALKGRGEKTVLLTATGNHQVDLMTETLECPVQRLGGEGEEKFQGTPTQDFISFFFASFVVVQLHCLEYVFFREFIHTISPFNSLSTLTHTHTFSPLSLCRFCRSSGL